MSDENDKPATPKSATGTVLGMPPAKPLATDSPEPDKPALKKAEPEKAEPEKAEKTKAAPPADADKTMLDPPRPQAPADPKGTLKGLGDKPHAKDPTMGLGDSDLEAVDAEKPNADDPTMALDAEADMELLHDLARGEEEAPKDQSTEESWPDASQSGISVPMALPTIAPSRRTLYMLAGGAGVVILLLMIAVIAGSGGEDEEPAVEEAAAEVDEPTGEEVEDAPAEPALPQPRELSAAEERQLEQLRRQARRRFSSQRFGDAAQFYRDAIEIDPSQAGLYAGLGAALGRDGEIAGAIDAYSMAVRLEPDSSGFHAALGRVYREGGDDEAAIAEYQRAFELDGENRAARTALTELGEAP